jgi:hypothetical protein
MCRKGWFRRPPEAAGIVVRWKQVAMWRARVRGAGVSELFRWGPGLRTKGVGWGGGFAGLGEHAQGSAG